MSEKPAPTLVVVPSNPRYDKVPDAWTTHRLLGQALPDVEDDSLWPTTERKSYRNTLRSHIEFCRTNGYQTQRGRRGMWNIIRVNNDIRAQREKETQARQLEDAEAVLAEGRAAQSAADAAKEVEKDAARKAAAQARAAARARAAAVPVPAVAVDVPPPLPPPPTDHNTVVHDRARLNAKQIYTSWGLSSIRGLQLLPSFPKPIEGSGSPRWRLSEIEAFETSDIGKAAIAKTVARGQRNKRSLGA